MKKIILLLLLFLITSTNIYSAATQDPAPEPFFTPNVDPGFGAEGAGDAQTAPGTYPISNAINYGIVTGLMIAGFFFFNRKKKTI